MNDMINALFNYFNKVFSAPCSNFYQYRITKAIYLIKIGYLPNSPRVNVLLW